MENINISEIIIQAINNIFTTMFSSIDNNLYQILDDITFINTDILTSSNFSTLFGSQKEGFLLIANSLLIGFLLYYCIKLLLSNLILSPVENPLQFIFKVVIFGILMNSSFFLCEQLILFVSTLSNIIRQLGENLFHTNICFTELINQLNNLTYFNNSNTNILSIDGLIKSFSTLGLLNLTLSYALRYVMIKVFVLLSPFAILSLTLPSSSNFFKSWLRSFLSLLLIQVLISIILIIFFSLDFTSSDLLIKFSIVGCIYALTKSNLYMKEVLGGISTEINSGINNFKNIIHN